MLRITPVKLFSLFFFFSPYDKVANLVDRGEAVDSPYLDFTKAFYVLY